MGRRPKQPFLQKRHTDGQQAHEKMLNTANYQRDSNQNYTSHWSEWPSLKSLHITNAGDGVKKREPSYTVGENANWCSYYGEQYEGSFKKLKTELPYDPGIPLMNIYPDKTLI